MPSPTISIEERRRRSLEAYRLAGLPPIGGGQQTDEEAAAEAEAKRIADAEAARLAEEEKHLNDAGKAALQKERDARKAAAKEAAEAKAELEALRKAKADADAAKAKEEEAEKAKRGEFEQLANDRAETIKSITGERDALKVEHEKLTEYFTKQYDAALKDLPEVITAFKPADDAGFAEKAAWLATAQEQAKKVNGGNGPKGPGFRPAPSDGSIPKDQAIEQAKRSGKYSA